MSDKRTLRLVVSNAETSTEALMRRLAEAARPAVKAQVKLGQYSHRANVHDDGPEAA